MKTKLMTLLIVALGCFAISANAQTSNDSHIKLVPANAPGTIKLIHAGSIDKSIDVRFIDSEGTISSDRITGTYPKGVLKRYDVSKVRESSFYVEVSSKDLTVTYRVTASKDKKKYTTMLERVEYHNALVASR